jgi:hypothetical protein
MKDGRPSLITNLRPPLKRIQAEHARSLWKDLIWAMKPFVCICVKWERCTNSANGFYMSSRQTTNSTD